MQKFPTKYIDAKMKTANKIEYTKLILILQTEKIWIINNLKHIDADKEKSAKHYFYAGEGRLYWWKKWNILVQKRFNVNFVNENET